METKVTITHFEAQRLVRLAASELQQLGNHRAAGVLPLLEAATELDTALVEAAREAGPDQLLEAGERVAHGLLAAVEAGRLSADMTVRVQEVAMLLVAVRHRRFVEQAIMAGDGARSTVGAAPAAA